LAVLLFPHSRLADSRPEHRLPPKRGGGKAAFRAECPAGGRELLRHRRPLPRELCVYRDHYGVRVNEDKFYVDYRYLLPISCGHIIWSSAMRRVHTIDLVFSLTLFCAFAASMLTVLSAARKSTELWRAAWRRSIRR
jgi:hypothetical protein